MIIQKPNFNQNSMNLHLIQKQKELTHDHMHISLGNEHTKISNILQTFLTRFRPIGYIQTHIDLKKEN